MHSATCRWLKASLVATSFVVAAYGCANGGDDGERSRLPAEQDDSGGDPFAEPNEGNSENAKGDDRTAGSSVNGAGGDTRGGQGGTAEKGGAGSRKITGKGGSTGAGGSRGTGGSSGTTPGGSAGRQLGSTGGRTAIGGGIKIFDGSTGNSEDAKANLAPGACVPNLTIELPLKDNEQPRADPLGRSEVCIAVSGEFQGWGCQGLESRPVTVNEEKATCASMVGMPAPLADGYRYFFIKAAVPNADGLISNTGGIWWF